MAQRVIARIDGASPASSDDGRGIGPVSKSGGLGVALAGLLAVLIVSVLATFGIFLDPVMVSTLTTLLGAGLSLLFMYYTPSKKIIDVVEIVTGRDVDDDGVVGSDYTPPGSTPTQT